MSHSERDDLPDLQRAKLGLDVNAGQVMGLAVDAQAGEHAHLGRPFSSAQPAVQHELAAADGAICIGCNGFNKANWKIRHRASYRGWIKAHNRHKIGAAILRHRTKDSHECVRAGLKRDGFAVPEVDKDFETLRGRNSELPCCDWHRKVSTI